MSARKRRDERGDIEARIDGTTICHWLARAADQYGIEPALSSRMAGGWHTRTWAELRREVLEAAAGFTALGLQPGQTVAIMATNRPEHVVADLGAVHAGAVPTTVGLTLGPADVAAIATRCAATVAVLEGAEELHRWQSVLERLPRLDKVVLLDPEAVPADERFICWSDLISLGRAELAYDDTLVDKRWKAIDPADPLTVIYTTNHDGDPALVALSHRDVLFELEAAITASRLTERGVSVSYLPYADINERVVGIYAPVRLAGHAYLSADPAQSAESLLRCDIDWAEALVP